MPTDDQLMVLREIDNAFAFDDTAKAEELVLDGYVQKDGDLYQLTPKGEKKSARQRRLGIDFHRERIQTLAIVRRPTRRPGPVVAREASNYIAQLKDIEPTESCRLLDYGSTVAGDMSLVCPLHLLVTTSSAQFTEAER